jgi:arabinofuranosyltransferase
LISTHRHWLPRIALAVLTLMVAGLFISAEVERTDEAGYPLDDSWIHAQIARNVSEGNGFAFNPGEPVAGSTAPLWTLVFGMATSLPIDTLWSIKCLGILLLWITACITVDICERCGLSCRESWLAGLLVVTTSRLVWGSLSGMEVMLYTALSTGAVALHLKHLTRPIYTETALWALAVLARPECLLLFPLAVIDRIRFYPTLRSAAIDHWKHLVLYSLILLPSVIYNLQTAGGPLPNTFYAKVGPYGLLGAIGNLDVIRITKTLIYYPFLQVLDFIRFAVENNLILALATPLFIFQAIKKRHEPTSWLIPMAIVIFPIVRGMIAPFKGPTFQNGRYAANYVPLLTVAGLIGFRFARDRLASYRDLDGPIAAIATVFVILIQPAMDLSSQADAYAQDVAAINKVHVGMGRWLAEHTDEDDVIATHDIGAIRYFSQRRVIDTVGLVTPDVLSYLKADTDADGPVLSFLESRRPDYLVIMPGWYPKLAQQREHFQPVHTIRPEGRSAVGGGRLVAYRATWPE